MERLIESKGILRYSHKPGYGYRLVVDIDPEIARLARYFVPKHVTLNTTRYAPHISVVRLETPKNLEVWGERDGKEVGFKYSPLLVNDHTYWWLRVWSDELVDLRVRMGLLPYGKMAKPPDGVHCFHTTIGNTKKLDVE